VEKQAGGIFSTGEIQYLQPLQQNPVLVSFLLMATISGGGFP
jgi:hypothetical protein